VPAASGVGEGPAWRTPRRAAPGRGRHPGQERTRAAVQL